MHVWVTFSAAKAFFKLPSATAAVSLIKLLAASKSVLSVDTGTQAADMLAKAAKLAADRAVFIAVLRETKKILTWDCRSKDKLNQRKLGTRLRYTAI